MDTDLKQHIYQLALQLKPEERRALAADLAALADVQPLTREQILGVLTTHADDLRQRGVTRIGVFGSHAHNEAGLTSDIDILVELNQPGFRVWSGVLAYLEDLLGRKVDLVETSALKPALRDRILQDVIYAEGFE